MLSDADDPAVVDALTRKCECNAKPGDVCVCVVHRPPHSLPSCPTATGRIVHHSRCQAPPRKGQ